MNPGILYSIIAYVLWGLLPLFWKSFHGIPAFEILLHRIVWSLVFLSFLILLQHNQVWIKKIKSQPKILSWNLLSSLLLSINWFTYIWAVSSNHIVESSLGYFLNPLVYVLLGRFFFGERINRNQTIAVIIAATGLIYLTFIYGKIPWIAIVLAISFGFYGLLRKRSPLKSLEGLSIETALLTIPALTILIIMEIRGIGHFSHTNISNNLLLICSGMATSIPLLFFAAGAKRITLTNLGFLQYIAPSLQFLLGVLIYKEMFPRTQFYGFLFIWTALLIYAIDSMKQTHRNRTKK